MITDRLMRRFTRPSSRDPEHAAWRDQQLREKGWSSRYVWPVPGPRDPSLSVKLRLPDGVALLDVGALAAAAPDAPAWVRSAAAEMRRVGPGAGVVAAAACVGREDPGEVLFTLTIVHAPLVDAPAMEVPGVDPDDPKVSQTVKPLSERVTLVDRLTMAPVVADGPEVPMLDVRYLVQTSYGGLAIGFTTIRSGMFGEEAAKLYHEVVSTVWIGEGDPPD